MSPDSRDKMSKAEKIQQFLSEHDRKAIWHMAKYLDMIYTSYRTHFEEDARQGGFESLDQYAATVLLEKIRDWDAGKPDAW